MYKKITSLLIWTLTTLTPIIAQTDTSKVKWLSFDETKSLFEKNQKPILIYFHDKKNDSCNLLLNETFGLDEVANYINILFYPIKIDIYSKDEITFFDGIKYTNTGKEDSVHSFVEKMLGKDPILPAIILFSKKAEGTIFQGFKDRDHIFPLLIYYAESTNETTNFDKFEKEYFKAYPIGQKQIITRLNLKWKTLPEALKLGKQAPKKLLINLYDNYSISSTMMQLQTYNNSINANYLNEHYYCVNIDLKTTDTLEFLGQKFVNDQTQHGYHQLPIALLNGKMTSPAFIIFDEDLKFIGREQRYFTPEDFELIMKFVGDNVYKTETIENYKKYFKSSFIEESKPK
jgi:thioredoxin-related protein